MAVSESLSRLTFVSTMPPKSSAALSSTRPDRNPCIHHRKHLSMVMEVSQQMELESRNALQLEPRHWNDVQ